MPKNCDNQATIFTARNSTLHERTNHIGIDCHYICDKVMPGVISTTHMTSSHLLADIFLKILAGISYGAMCTKLGNTRKNTVVDCVNLRIKNYAQLFKSDF